MRTRAFFGWCLGTVALLSGALNSLAQPTPSAPGLLAGPMVAGVRPTEALIWVQLRAGQQAWVVAQDSATLGVSSPPNTSPANPANPASGAARCHLTGLHPATWYRYQVWLIGWSRPAGSGHFRTPPADTATTDFTFALGSCAFIADPYPAGGYPIFFRIHEQHPDLMLWLGDNVYLWGGEWNDPAAAIRRYAHTRAAPELAPLLANTAHAAIWDDHDFGPNSGDSTLPTRATMLDVFRQFWAPDFYAAPPGGTTGHFSWGDAEFFLLDNRYWRTPRRGTPRRARSQLGAAQRAWLLKGLRASTATFKFVAVGGQVLTTSVHGETFARGFRAERRALLQSLDSAQVKNVVFLTGDRHFAELSVRRPRAAPAQYDLTASPLTAGPAKPSANRLRVAGTVIQGNNFATIKLSGPRGARKITFSGFDATGERRWQRIVAAE